MSCYEPERLADKAWAEIGSEDFACKPWAGVRSGAAGAVRVTPGINVSLECEVTSYIAIRAVNKYTFVKLHSAMRMPVKRSGTNNIQHLPSGVTIWSV